MKKLSAMLCILITLAGCAQQPATSEADPDASTQTYDTGLGSDGAGLAIGVLAVLAIGALIAADVGKNIGDAIVPE